MRRSPENPSLTEKMLNVVAATERGEPSTMTDDNRLTSTSIGLDDAAVPPSPRLGPDTSMRASPADSLLASKLSYYRSLSRNFEPQDQALLEPPRWVIEMSATAVFLRGLDKDSGRAGSAGLVFSLWNTMMGSTLLVMPYAFYEAGWLLGLILCIICAFASCALNHARPDRLLPLPCDDRTARMTPARRHCCTQVAHLLLRAATRRGHHAKPRRRVCRLCRGAQAPQWAVSPAGCRLCASLAVRGVVANVRRGGPWPWSGLVGRARGQGCEAFARRALVLATFERRSRSGLLAGSRVGTGRPALVWRDRSRGGPARGEGRASAW